MGDTLVSSLSNAVRTKYQADYLTESAKTPVWGQFVDWEPIQEGQGGSSFTYLALNDIADTDPDNAKLPENDDITPTELSDDSFSLTPYEYGRRVKNSRLVRFQANPKIREQSAQIVARNRVTTIEKAIRSGALGGTLVMRQSGVNARTGLDSSNDTLSWDFLTELKGRALSLGIEPIDSEGNLVCIMHDIVESAVVQLSEVKGVGQYAQPDVIYNGQVAKVGGFRFIRSPFGKVYLSGGATAQSATSLSADVAAGATSFDVASATGLTAGDWITIGTLESATAEQVLITDVNGTTLTIEGAGNSLSNFGCKFAHSSGDAVTEADNVAGIVVIGRNSLKGVYGADTGKYGIPVLKEGVDSLNRLISQGWLWYGGIGIVPKNVLRAEFAITTHMYGDN